MSPGQKCAFGGKGGRELGPSCYKGGSTVEGGTVYVRSTLLLSLCSILVPQTYCAK